MKTPADILLALYPHDHKRREPEGWTRWSMAALVVFAWVVIAGLLNWWDDEGEPGPNVTALISAHRGE